MYIYTKKHIDNERDNITFNERATIWSQLFKRAMGVFIERQFSCWLKEIWETCEFIFKYYYQGQNSRNWII